MSDVSPLSAVSELAFDSLSHVLSCFLFLLLLFLPRPLALSVLSLVCYWSILQTFFSPENSLFFPSVKSLFLFCMALVEQLGNDSW